MNNPDSGMVKEQTIRSLLAQCQKAQAEISAQLENNFDRNPKETTKDEDRPSRPNVLDEIMDSLKDLNEAQIRTIQFLVECVNPKF